MNCKYNKIDIIKFVEEYLGIELRPWQKIILRRMKVADRK